METLLSSLGPATTTTSVEDLLFNTTTEYLLNSITPECSESSLDCKINHSIVCVGQVEYCHLTKEEYEDMLYDYIAPSVPEWILIFSHIIVFLMGLVSIFPDFTQYQSISLTKYNFESILPYGNVKHR